MIKAIIVDDEKLVRKGLISMINWSALGIAIVGEAADGPSALKLIRSTPVDLLFTDITMPGMSGLELIRQTRLQFPHVRTVVLTCHHEFDYIQEALRLGVIDYIVKTLLEMENADDTIARIIERYRWEEAMRASSSNGSAGRLMPASSALVFRPLLPESEKSELFALSPVRNNPFIEWEEGGMVPLVHPMPADGLVRELTRAIRERWEITLITDLQNVPLEEVKETVRLHLENALFYHSRSGTLAQLAYGELIHSSPSRSGDDPAPEEEWLNRHQDLRWAFGTEDWNRLISEVEERRPGADRLLAFGEALCRDWKGSLFSQTEAEHLLEASHSCRNWPDWTVWLRRIADLAKRRMLDLALSKEVILCLIRAMIYMRLHAYDKMNQADVADHVNMSRSYFSQCFSRFAGQPFKDVLRTMRMERAKAYLLESDTPVYEIAMSVGFEDDKYFSKLFRDLFGKYPTEFRMGGKPF